MFVGLLQVDLLIPESSTLKEKRFVLQSLKTRLTNKFNLSVAEVDYLDKWQRTVLGMAMVGNEHKFVQKAMNQVLNFIENEPNIQLLEHSFEVI